MLCRPHADPADLHNAPDIVSETLARLVASVKHR
jgi:hypothetical protein